MFLFPTKLKPRSKSFSFSRCRHFKFDFFKIKTSVFENLRVVKGLIKIDFFKKMRFIMFSLKIDLLLTRHKMLQQFSRSVLTLLRSLDNVSQTGVVMGAALSVVARNIRAPKTNAFCRQKVSPFNEVRTKV